MADVAAGEVARAGPKVERGTWGDFRLLPGAAYDQKQVEGGQPGDYWVYDGKLIYVQKRFVAIPLDATPDGDLKRFDNTVMDMIAMTYDEMRPGCYDPKARAAGPRDRRSRRLLAVPDVSTILRPDLPRGRRQGPRSRLHRGVQRLDDRGMVR